MLDTCQGKPECKPCFRPWAGAGGVFAEPLGWLVLLHVGLPAWQHD